MIKHSQTKFRDPASTPDRWFAGLVLLMAPPTWATDEQRAFLLGEDATWSLIKESGRTLKSFYIQTTRAFLAKWPRHPSQEILTLAGGDEAAAKALVEQRAQEVSTSVSICTTLTHSDFLYVSKSRLGTAIFTAKRRGLHRPRNHSSTLLGRTLAKDRHYRNGKLIQLSTTAQPPPHSALR